MKKVETKLLATARGLSNSISSWTSLTQAKEKKEGKDWRSESESKRRMRNA